MSSRCRRLRCTAIESLWALKLGCVRCSDAVDDKVSVPVLLVRGPEWLGEDVAWDGPKQVSVTAETSLIRGSK